jgi:hypothetical protein
MNIIVLSKYKLSQNHKGLAYSKVIRFLNIFFTSVYIYYSSELCMSYKGQTFAMTFKLTYYEENILMKPKE